MKFEVYICLIELELITNMGEQAQCEIDVGDTMNASLQTKEEDDAVRAEINAVIEMSIQSAENECTRRINQELVDLIAGLMRENQRLHEYNETLLHENQGLREDKFNLERQIDALLLQFRQQNSPQI